MEQRPTHILVECPELIASVRVGVLNVLKPLERDNVCAVRFRETRNIKREDLVWCDILVCVRGCETMSVRILREAKRLGRKVFYFLDDDLLHLPEDSQAYAYFECGNHQEALRDCLEISDGLWGVNSLIEKIYLPLCGTKRWICTRVPVQLKRVQPVNNLDIVRVIYAGSVDHQNIVREILAPAVRIVLEEHKEKVEFTFIGPNPNLQSCPQVFHHSFFENYDQYRKFVDGKGYQIGLAPIRTDKFYQCKYYNKYVEYTSIGAVGVYTDSDLYRQIICHEENGALCSNTPEDWAREILRLVKDSNLRRKCLKNAEILLKKEFEPARVAKHFVDQVPEFSWFRAPHVSKKQIRLRSPLVYFYWDRLCYLFHTYHAFAFPIIAWKAGKKFIKWILGRTGC